MYEQFYNLVEPPFSLTPDPKYFYRSESHHRAFEQLRHGIQQREGFMVVYGDIGSGKTTLCRAMIDTIDNNVQTALLLNPFLNETELLKSMLDDFGVFGNSCKPQSRQDLLRLLNDFLVSVRRKDGRAVLLIDEAQNLPLPTLEQIRILSNLEENKEKLLQIVLVGQLEVMDVLAKPALRNLVQRISLKCELSPLTAAETSLYVRHRLAIAGGGRTLVAFTPDGLWEIHRYSGGLPRLINQIADRSLLAGMALSTTMLDRRPVREAVDHLQFKKPKSPHARRWPFFAWSAGSK
jgi:general secretion pathway protein A